MTTPRKPAPDVYFDLRRPGKDTHIDYRLSRLRVRTGCHESFVADPGRIRGYRLTVLSLSWTVLDSCCLSETLVPSVRSWAIQRSSCKPSAKASSIATTM